MVDSTRRCKEGISYSPPSLETSRHSPRLADIVVQLGEKIISRSVDTNSGVAFLRGKKENWKMQPYTLTCSIRDDKNEGEGSLGQSCVPC